MTEKTKTKETKPAPQPTGPPAVTTTDRASSLVSEFIKYLISAMIIGLGAGSLWYLSTLAKKPDNVPPTALIQKVRTFEVSSYSGRLDKVVSGTVVAFREVDVAAQVGGRIEKKYPVCEAGKFVTKGVKLFEIDKTEWNLELKSTQADIKQAEESIREVEQEIKNGEANLKLAIDEYDLQKADYDRNLRAQGALSQSELNAAERGLLAAKNRQQQAENSLASLKARKSKLQATLEFTKTKLDRINLNLERSTVVAPASGIIVREMAEEGNVIRSGDQLVTIEDTSHSEVLCNLTTSDLNWVRNYSKSDDTVEPENLDQNSLASIYRIPKTDVTIYDRDTPNVEWRGVLERFDGVGRDEITKTFPVRIVVRKPVVSVGSETYALVKGMFVKCRMEVETSAADDQQFVSFPTVGLRPGNYIWVVRDKKLHRIDVDVVDHTEAKTEDGKIKPFVIAYLGNGLQLGDKVVVTPLTQPTEGTVVQLESETESDAKSDSDKEVVAESQDDTAAATNADLDKTKERS